MKNYDSDSPEAIIRRLKPIALCLSPKKADFEIIQGQRNKIIVHTRYVALKEPFVKDYVAHGKLVFHTAFDEHKIVEYPPMGYQGLGGYSQTISKHDREIMNCVYDPVGLVICTDKNTVASYHALMLPPKDGQLGSCFALLRMFHNKDCSIGYINIVPASECPDVFWGKYATDYEGVELLPLKHKLEEKIVKRATIPNYYAQKVLYIGDTPVCAWDGEYRKYISLEQFRAEKSYTI